METISFNTYEFKQTDNQALLRFIVVVTVTTQGFKFISEREYVKWYYKWVYNIAPHTVKLKYSMCNIKYWFYIYVFFWAIININILYFIYVLYDNYISMFSQN